MIIKTIIFSIILVTLSLLGLGIGLIITGKPRLRKGCGKLPKDNKKCSDETGCDICNPKSSDNNPKK